MISKRIDRLVEWTKWPAAVVVLCTCPLTIVACGYLLARFAEFPGYATMFTAGIAIFVFLVRTPIARTPFARKLVELERDLTQSVLALAMLHPVVGYGENQDKGSRVRWLGRGNWLMLAAPYFFPMATMLFWLCSLLLFPSLRCLVLGFGISYHVTAVAMQCQVGDSELRRLGRKFCWMFLPAMNLLVAGCVAAYALNGFTGIGDFMYDWCSVPRQLLNSVWGLSFPASSMESYVS